MSNFKLITFLVPAFALFLVVVLYISMLKMSINKAALKRFILIVTLLAYLINFAWEIMQSPLYRGFYEKPHLAVCALASVADAIMVVLLYLCFALLYRGFFWSPFFKMQRIILLILVGGTGAVFSEIRHVSAGNWAYAESMPIIPIVNVGLLPVLQFMFLPLIIYYLSFYFMKYGDKRDKT